MSGLEVFLGKTKGFLVSALASGKKNAPSLMTAGSVALGWTAVYLFWKHSRNADKKIAYEEQKLADKAEENGTEPEKLKFQEKAIIYLQYCWLEAVLGVASTGLAIGANKINVSRLAEMALLTKFMDDRNEKQNEMIEKLKDEVDPKKLNEIKEDIREKEIPKSEVLKALETTPGEGNTLFIDKLTSCKWRGNIMDVKDGIDAFNKRLKERHANVVKRKINDAFYVSEYRFAGDEDEDSVYSTLDLEEFLKSIGELPHMSDDYRMGEILEFRYRGGGGVPVDPNDILEYAQYIDPSTGAPAVCFIDYQSYLRGTEELLDRD